MPIEKTRGLSGRDFGDWQKTEKPEAQPQEEEQHPKQDEEEAQKLLITML